MASPYGFLRWSILPMLRSRIWTVRGLENIPTAGGFILTPNHQSWIDSAILTSAVYRRLTKPIKFVAQSNKYGAFGGLPILSTDRSHVLDVAMHYLNTGYPIVVFPEGNSNTEVELRMGKTGAARLALRSGMPVIPIGIRGTKGVRAWASLIWFWSLIRPCHLVIGQPVTFPKTEVKEGDDELLRRTTQEIMRRISELSGKAMPGEGPILGQRGWLWLFAWHIFRPLVQWRIRMYGKEHLPEHGPFIVAANHPSYFDAPALAMAVFHISSIQPLFLTKATVTEAFRRLGGQTILNALGMLPLDNTDRSKVLEPAIAHLKRGGAIGIFPEGTRNKPALNPDWRTHLLKGRTGAVRLHLATHVPVIPASIKAPKGLGLWETIIKSLLPWNFIRVTFGPPVVFQHAPADLTSATKTDLDRLTQQLMTQIGSLSGMHYRH